MPIPKVLSLRMSGSSAPLSVWHRLWRQFPAGPRRRLLTSLGAAFAPRIDPTAPAATTGLAVVGELSRSSGLGEGARLMLRALDRLGIANWAIDVGPVLPAHVADFPSVRQLPPAGAALLLHVNPPLLPLVLMRLPRSLLRGRRIIGYWSWELPAAPDAWKAGVPFVHEVWTPSAFVADAVQPLLPNRVQVVAYPMALAPPAPSRMDRMAFGLPRDALVTLVSFNLASSFERKNPLAAIAAFRMAFGDRPDRMLVLKVGNPGHYPADFARLQQAVAGAANIRLETRVFPPADLHALTAVCDIVLSLHRSEGFGLGMAEGMLLGKPVIATGWSGNVQYMDRTSAALIGYRLMDSHDPRGLYSGSQWADPDVAEAAEQLRVLAENTDARATLGGRAREFASRQLSGDGLAIALRRIGLNAAAS